MESVWQRVCGEHLLYAWLRSCMLEGRGLVSKGSEQVGEAVRYLAQLESVNAYL